METLAELSASRDEPGRPFVDDFLIPRKATAQAFRQVLNGTKLVLLEGAPFAGKSNVLREVALRTAQHESIATLYVEGGAGYGLIQSLADTLYRSLSWPVTREEARTWLSRVSQSAQYRLVLTIDGLDPADDDARREIEDVSASLFGPGLTVIVALDDATSDRIVSSVKT